jgi:pimeloyl-ACP methyl ester carboxylesterase
MDTAGSPAAQFRAAQDAVLAETGVAAKASFIDVEAPPLRVQLLEAGAGVPVVMIHGGNSVAASWAPLLPRLSESFHLLMPDRPGCGLTTMFYYRGVDLRRHGPEFIGGVLDSLGLDRVALIGNSMGGFFAMAFAIDHPERVSALVLTGEPAGADGNPRLFHRLVGTRGINAFLYATALSPAKDAAGARAGLMKGRLVAQPGRVSETLYECFAAGARLPGATRSWRTMVERVFVPAGLGLFARRTTATHALLPQLERLVAPTLLLWGDKDPLGTVETGRAIADAMPNARLTVVSDASHLVWLDQPDFCADAILDFLNASGA